MDSEVTDELVGILRDDAVPDVRREAARALGLAGADAVDPLIAALDDTNNTVRRAAALSLGRIGDDRAVAALLDALANRPELWQEASAGLAAAGDHTVVARLLPLLRHPSSMVRRGAVRALAAAGKPAEDEPLYAYTDDDGHRHPLF